MVMVRYRILSPDHNRRKCSYRIKKNSVYHHAFNLQMFRYICSSFCHQYASASGNTIKEGPGRAKGKCRHQLSAWLAAPFLLLVFLPLGIGTSLSSPLPFQRIQSSGVDAPDDCRPHPQILRLTLDIMLQDNLSNISVNSKPILKDFMLQIVTWSL